jgi:hypothetical protein
MEVSPETVGILMTPTDPAPTVQPGDGATTTTVLNVKLDFLELEARIRDRLHAYTDEPYYDAGIKTAAREMCRQIAKDNPHLEPPLPQVVRVDSLKELAAVAAVVRHNEPPRDPDNLGLADIARHAPAEQGTPPVTSAGPSLRERVSVMGTVCPLVEYGDADQNAAHADGYTCGFFACRDELLPLATEAAIERDSAKSSANALANKAAEFQDQLAARDKEVEGLRKRVEELEGQIEDLKDPVYCPQCGACGHAGCCPPSMCKYVKGYQGDYNELARDWETIRAQLTAANERERGLREAFDEIRDSVLHGRGPLEGYDVDSDITNAVLSIIDDARAALAPAEGTPPADQAEEN